MREEEVDAIGSGLVRLHRALNVLLFSVLFVGFKLWLPSEVCVNKKQQLDSKYVRGKHRGDRYHCQ